jgi:hypothetical protein
MDFVIALVLAVKPISVSNTVRHSLCMHDVNDITNATMKNNLALISNIHLMNNGTVLRRYSNGMWKAKIYGSHKPEYHSLSPYRYSL